MYELNNRCINEWLGDISYYSMLYSELVFESRWAFINDTTRICTEMKPLLPAYLVEVKDRHKDKDYLTRIQSWIKIFEDTWYYGEWI